VAQDWLWFIAVNPSALSILPVSTQAKFFRRAGKKFLLKAMRLAGFSGDLDFNEKLRLRKRLDELASAHINTLILSESQADTVLGFAAQAGLCAIVEVTVNANDFESPVSERAAVDRIAKTLNALRGQSALIGLLIDCTSVDGPISGIAPDAIRRAVNAVASSARELKGSVSIALKRQIALPATQLVDEDFSYISLTKINPATVGPVICALHEVAGARPLVIEIGEELPGQVEVVERAFGFGAAGMVAPSMRPAVPDGRQNLRMLVARELLPFDGLDESSAPLPTVTPMVSVVVTARDDESTIAACIESIGSLAYPDYEVIVIDDGSRDHVTEIVAKFPEVRLIRHPREGFGAIRNVAVRAARGDLIAFTRADCTVDSDWLSIAARMIIEGGFDGCGGPILSSTDASGLVARMLTSIERSESASENGRATQFSDRNMIVRKSSWKAVGGFDAQFVEDGGDLDLCARMLEAGMRIGWCPSGLVWRLGRTTIGEFVHSRIRHGRSEAMLAAKHPSRFGAGRAGALGLRAGRKNPVREGVAVRSLSTVLASAGSIAESVARLQYILTRAKAVALSNRITSEPAKQISLGNRAQVGSTTRTQSRKRDLSLTLS
jgi:glycosyltransferase involved in cell wall biosynthesis